MKGKVLLPESPCERRTSGKCTHFNLVSPFNSIMTNKLTQTTEIPSIRAINKPVNNNYMLKKC
jgi:hypothetical protein